MHTILSSSYRLFITTIIFFTVTTIASAVNYTSRATGAWTTTTTWNPNGVPGIGDNVTINGNGFTVTIAANAACASLTFGPDGNNTTLTMNAGTILTVNGNVVFNAPTANTRTKLWNINAATALVNGGLTLNAGTADSRVDRIVITTGTLHVAGSVSFANTLSNPRTVIDMSGGAGNLIIGGDLGSTGNFGTLTPGTTSTITFDSTVAQSIGLVGAITLNNLTVNKPSGTLTATTAISVANLAINSGATFATGNFQMTLGGNYTNSGGTFTAGSSPIVIAGTAATQSIDGFTTTGTVSMTKTAGTATFMGAVNGGGLTINGNGGTLNLGAGFIHTFTGAFVRTIGTLNLNSSTVNIGGTTTNTGGTFTAGTSTVNYYAAGVQTIANVTYNNLTLSGTSAKTTTGATVNGILSMEGTATASVAPTYGAAAALQYNTATPRTAGVEWITPFAATGGIIIANTGTITLNAAKTLNASVSLTINNGASLSVSATNYNISIGGSWTNNGTFTAGTSTTTFTGTAQTIGGTSNTAFGNIIIASGATYTMNNNNSCTGLTFAASATASSLTHGSASALTVNGSVTINAPTANGFATDWNINDGSAVVSGSVTLVAGTADTRITRINITTGTLDVTGDVSFTNTTGNPRTQIVFNGTGNLFVGGNLGSTGNYGTLTPSTGTVTLDGAGTQALTIPAASTMSVYNLVVNKSAGTANLNIPATKPVGGSLSVLAGTAFLAADIYIAGDLTVSGGTLDLSTFVCQRSAAGGTFTLGGTATLRVGGASGCTVVNQGGTNYNYASNFPGYFAVISVSSSSTVEYYRAGAQDVPIDGFTYGNLILSGSGIKMASQEPTATPTPTQDSNFVVNGTLTIGSGTTLNTAQEIFYSICNGPVNIQDGGTLDAFSGGGSVRTHFYGPTVNTNTTGVYLPANGVYSGFTSDTKFGNTTISGNALALYNTRITGYTTSNVNITITSGDTLTIQSGATFNPDSTVTATITGATLTLSGTARVTRSNAKMANQYIGAPATGYSAGTVEFAGRNEIVDNLPYGTLLISSPTVSLDQSVTTQTLNVAATGYLTTGANIMNVTTTRTGNGLVNGSVRHTHVFTTGTPYYFEGPNTYLTFTSLTASPTDVTITSYPGTSIPAGNPAYAIKRYYTITPNGGSGLAATLRLHYDATTELNGLNEALFTLWRYNSGTSIWEDQGASSRSGGSANSFVEQTGISSFSNWTITTNLSPLPVQLVSFTGSAKRFDITLDWNTISEKNNYGFEIERRPVGGTWSKIGFVGGNGSTTVPHTYSYTDKNAPAGTLQYRLKQVDFDAAFEYSKTIEVVSGAAPKSFSLGQNYPSPFNPSTTIEFTIPEDAVTSLKVYNVLGQEVASLIDNVSLPAGVIHTAMFDGGKLSSGTYIYVLRSGKYSAVKKMVLLK